MIQEAQWPPLAAEEQIGIATLAADFLHDVATQPQERFTSRADLGVTIRKCMAAAGILDAAALARTTNVSRITGWYWLNGRSVPTFSQTLRICYVFRLSLNDFLQGAIPAKLTPRGTGELALRSVRPTPRRFDEVKLGREMEAFCARRQDSPPSVVEVADEIGTSPRVLRKHFPAACRAITTRWRAFVQAQRAARQEELRQIIRDVALREKIQRGRVRRCDLIKLLPKPGVLRSATTRDLVKQTLLDLEN